MLTICCSVQLKGRPRIRTIIAAFWLVNRRASGSTPKNTYSNKFRIYYLFELFGKMFNVYDKLMMQIVNEGLIIYSFTMDAFYSVGMFRDIFDFPTLYADYNIVKQCSLVIK